MNLLPSLSSAKIINKNTPNLDPKNHLLGLSEAGAQQRQEDSGDGHVVSWLSEARVLSTGEHRHAPGDVTDGHLVTLRDDARSKGSEKVACVQTSACGFSRMRLLTCS